MALTTQQKLSFGSVLATLGGAGTVLGSALGFASLGRPWSFLAGFVAGVLAGTGVSLAIAGLIETRASRSRS